MSSAPQMALKGRYTECRDCGARAQSERCYRCFRKHQKATAYDRAALRFLEAFEQRGPTDCWEWLRCRSPSGYARIGVLKDLVLVHRFSYEHFIGPIPPGLQIDHLCRNRSCVNPGHLEPVTARENTLRGLTITAANAAKTHCKRGHPFDDQNTYVDARGSRHCRACTAARHRRYSELKALMEETS